MSTKIKKNLDAIIFDKLKEELIASRWKPGQQISPDEIAEQYGVSRTPVVQAIRMLAQEGILNIRSTGRIELPVFSVEQITDICKVRILLEQYAIKMICELKCDIEVKKLTELAHECAIQISKYDNIVESRKLDLKIHRAIVESSGSECLLGCYVKVQGQFMAANYLLLSHTDYLQSVASSEHFDIFEHLSKYDYKKASKALEHHIMSGCMRLVEYSKNNSFLPS